MTHTSILSTLRLGRLPLLARLLIWCAVLLVWAAAAPAVEPSFPAANPPPPHPLPPPIPAGGLRPQALNFPIPRTGDQKLLIVLADFSDRAGLFTGLEWREFFFGADGFADYYEEVSYDQLRYTGDVVGIKAGVPVSNSAEVAYIRLPHPITFYADGLHGFKVGAGQFPKNIGGAVFDALEALDDAGFDFAPYANPGTGEIDNLIVVYGGSDFSATGDENNSLGATAYRLSWAGAPGGQFTADGGQTADNYTFCPDQRFVLSGDIAYIGPCSHEQGHALGMGDMYDFSYTTAGAGQYDLMAYGLYGGSGGERPMHSSAFTKDYYGWLAPTVAQAGAHSFQLAALETHPEAIRLNPNGQANSAEYFLLENRQGLGFDSDWAGAANGLCTGLFIWHIDQDIVGPYLFNLNTLASAGGPPHQGAIVVEADGGYDLINPPMNQGECSDAWAPGQTWNDTTTPNAHLWDGSPSHLSVTFVSRCSDGSLALNITVGGVVVQRVRPAVLQPAGTVLIFLPLMTYLGC